MDTTAKKLLGGAILTAGVIAIVYLTGIDKTTPFAPHRILGWGDGGPACVERRCYAADASVTECVDDDVGTHCSTVGTTECKDVVVACPALRCQVATVLMDEHALEAARLSDASDATSRGTYGRWRACGDPEHGLPFEPMPVGMEVVGGVNEVAWQLGWQKTDVWLSVAKYATKPADDAPFDCACGPGCRTFDGKKPAGSHVVLANATAPDAGECRSVPCVAMQGERPEAIIATCCKDECAGRNCGTGLCGSSCGVCADGFNCIGYACYSSADAG